MSEKQYFVYFLANKNNSVIYVGVTSNLIRRVYQHKNKQVSGFTFKYNLSKLVYFEMYSDVMDAIRREKQIKAGSRSKKVELILAKNPKWADLYGDLA